jgi:8-oxo-dGTP diphosphatase
MPYTYDYPRPSVTTDVALFTIRANELAILLIERGHAPFKGHWALPGGFVDIDEDLDSCAKRELEEETGVREIYLEQLYTFGAPDRDPERGRVISVAYYALAPAEHIQPKAASDAAKVQWFPIRQLPPLAFDHARIIATAYERLAAKLHYSTIALQLLPEKFTLSQLQAVYETIVGEVLDKRNFRKRILAQDCLQECGKLLRKGKHRPARLYQMKTPGTVIYSK